MARKERKSRTSIILVIFIAGIMVSSIMGVMFYGYNDETSKIDYNGFALERKEGYWAVNIDDKQINFRYAPDQVDDIGLSESVSSIISNALEIDYTSFINDTYKEEIALAQYELNQELNKINAYIYLRGGFTTNTTFRPIITCSDATSAIPVLFFKQSNETQVTLKEGCIIAEARSSLDVLRIKDRLLYSIIGIVR